MPAAPLRDRRFSSRSRAGAPVDRPRPRAVRPASAPTSKLSAARTVGLNAPIAVAGAALLGVMVLVAALATGGRAERAIAGGRRLAERLDVLISPGEAAQADPLAALGFRVDDVHLQGASHASQAEIFKAAAIPHGAPIFSVDLDGVRARVEAVGWVERARIIRLLPNTLVIAVTERPLMAVWEHRGRREVVAANGQVVGQVDPARFAGLPLVIGDGANLGVAALLPLIAAHPGLATRLLGYRRVDDRRWDVLLKDGGVVLLPAQDEAAALDRLERLDRQGRVLSLGLARIDLRDPEFTVVRPRQSAAGPPAPPIHGT